MESFVFFRELRKRGDFLGGLYVVVDQNFYYLNFVATPGRVGGFRG
jgi:hypothetical protein